MISYIYIYILYTVHVLFLCIYIIYQRSATKIQSKVGDSMQKLHLSGALSVTTRDWPGSKCLKSTRQLGPQAHSCGRHLFQWTIPKRQKKKNGDRFLTHGIWHLWIWIRKLEENSRSQSFCRIDYMSFASLQKQNKKTLFLSIFHWRVQPSRNISGASFTGICRWSWSFTDHSLGDVCKTLAALETFGKKKLIHLPCYWKHI